MKSKGEKSQGEIEAAVCDGISRFQQEFIGRGPRDIHAHLVGLLLVVRLQGVLTPVERQLIASRHDPAGDGAAQADPGTDASAEKWQRPLPAQAGQGLHGGHGAGTAAGRGGAGDGRAPDERAHDISTVTGEEVIVFSLAEAPACRPKKVKV